MTPPGVNRRRADRLCSAVILCYTDSMQALNIQTRDGICPSYVFTPAGAGPWPAVLVFMDGLAIRPAMLELGERLATSIEAAAERHWRSLTALFDATLGQ